MTSFGEDSAGHEHTEECAVLFASWRRYHAVAEDRSGVFGDHDRAAAARERDMLARQMSGAGCDPFTLLAIEAAEDGGVEDDAAQDPR